MSYSNAASENPKPTGSMSSTRQKFFEGMKETNAFTKYNHFVYDEISEDCCRMHLDLVPESLNPEGNVHGGCYFALADSCGGALARADGRIHVTLEASCHYLSTVSEGRILAVGRVKRRGRTITVADVDVTDEQGKVLFTSTFSYFCVSPQIG